MILRTTVYETKQGKTKKNGNVEVGMGKRENVKNNMLRNEKNRMVDRE